MVLELTGQTVYNAWSGFYNPLIEVPELDSELDGAFLDSLSQPLATEEDVYAFIARGAKVIPVLQRTAQNLSLDPQHGTVHITDEPTVPFPYNVISQQRPHLVVPRHFVPLTKLDMFLLASGQMAIEEDRVSLFGDIPIADPNVMYAVAQQQHYWLQAIVHSFLFEAARELHQVGIRTVDVEWGEPAYFHPPILALFKSLRERGLAGFAEDFPTFETMPQRQRMAQFFTSRVQTILAGGYQVRAKSTQWIQPRIASPIDLPRSILDDWTDKEHRHHFGLLSETTSHTVAQHAIAGMAHTLFNPITTEDDIRTVLETMTLIAPDLMARIGNTDHITLRVTDNLEETHNNYVGYQGSLLNLIGMPSDTEAPEHCITVFSGATGMNVFFGLITWLARINAPADFHADIQYPRPEEIQQDDHILPRFLLKRFSWNDVWAHSAWFQFRKEAAASVRMPLDQSALLDRVETALSERGMIYMRGQWHDIIEPNLADQIYHEAATYREALLASQP